jgi:hypothetical protein
MSGHKFAERGGDDLQIYVFMTDIRLFDRNPHFAIWRESINRRNKSARKIKMAYVHQLI